MRDQCLDILNGACCWPFLCLAGWGSLAGDDLGGGPNPLLRLVDVLSICGKAFPRCILHRRARPAKQAHPIHHKSAIQANALETARGRPGPASSKSC